MANQKLSQLPTAAALTGSELVYLDQSAASVKALLSVIQTFTWANPKPLPLRRVTTSGVITVTAADCYIIVNNGATTTISVDPSVLPVGRPITVKVGSDAGTHPVTITPTSGTIDGLSSFLMNIGYMAITFINNGSELSVL